MTVEMSTKALQSLYNHLTKSFSAEEAREILIQRYPEAEGDIHLLVDGEDKEPELKTVVKAQVSKTSSAKKTQIERVAELYAAAEVKTRAVMIPLIVEALGVSAATANVYFYKVKNK